jgi:hypothetical protein
MMPKLASASWALGFAISFALRLILGGLTFIAGPVTLAGYAKSRLNRSAEQNLFY